MSCPRLLPGYKAFSFVLLFMSELYICRCGSAITALANLLPPPILTCGYVTKEILPQYSNLAITRRQSNLRSCFRPVIVFVPFVKHPKDFSCLLYWPVTQSNPDPPSRSMHTYPTAYLAKPKTYMIASLIENVLFVQALEFLFSLSRSSTSLLWRLAVRLKLLKSTTQRRSRFVLQKLGPQQRHLAQQASSHVCRWKNFMIGTVKIWKTFSIATSTKSDGMPRVCTSRTRISNLWRNYQNSVEKSELPLTT